MSDRIRDDEPDVSEPIVRALLDSQCQQWAALSLTYLETSCTDNAMWRVHLDDGDDVVVVVRLPRRPGSAAQNVRELDMLQRLADSPLAPIMRTPAVRHRTLCALMEGLRLRAIH